MKRILLAEDEDILRMLIVDSLENDEIIIDEAADGHEAYELFVNHEYDLLLLDYMMPGMTGLEVLKKVREHPSKGNVKTLMLTAKSQRKDEEFAKLAGVDFFLAKPFSPIKLVELVEDILGV